MNDQPAHIDPLYFHVQMMQKETQHVYLCKVLLSDHLELYLFSDRQWQICATLSYSSFIEPFSGLLGASWLSFKGKMYFAIVFSNFYLLLEKDVLCSLVQSFFSQSSSPSVSPILSNTSSAESLFCFDKFQFQKFNFDRNIASFTALANGILVSSDHGLGYVASPDSITIPIKEANYMKKMYFLKTISILDSCDNYLSYIFGYSAENDYFFIIAVSFSPSKLIPTFMVFPSDIEFQKHLKHILLDPFRKHTMTCSVSASDLYIFIKSDLYLTVLKICNGLVSLSVRSLDAGDILAQSILAIFNGTLTENDEDRFLSVPFRPLVPIAFSAIIKNNTVYCLIENQDELIHLPLDVVIDPTLVDSAVIKVFMYDYKLCIFIDTSSKTPIYYELDLVSTVLSSHLLSEKTEHSLFHYKIFLGLFSFSSDGYCFFRFLSTCRKQKCSNDQWISLFKSDHSFINARIDAMCYLKNYLICYYCDLMLFKQELFAEYKHCLSVLLEQLFNYKISDINGLLQSLLSDPEKSLFYMSLLAFSSDFLKYVFPTTYFFLQLWNNLSQHNTIGYYNDFICFAFAVCRKYPISYVLLRSFGQTLIKTFLPTVENALLQNQFCWTFYPGVSTPFYPYYLFFFEEYRFLCKSIDAEIISCIQPNVLRQFLDFFNRPDIYMNLTQLPFECSDHKTNTKCTLKTMESLFSLESVEYLTFLKPDVDQSQMELFLERNNFDQLYLKESILLKVQLYLTDLIIKKKAHMPIGLLLSSSYDFPIKPSENEEPGAYFNRILSQVQQKIHFSTHSTAPSFDTFKQIQLFEFLLCTKAALAMAEKDVDISHILSIRPDGKANSTITIYQWSAYLFGSGIAGAFSSQVPQDVILEFISVPETSIISTNSHKIELSHLFKYISSSSFFLSFGLSLFGSKNCLLMKASCMHFPSLIFSNHLNSSSEDSFNSNIISHPIVDLPQHYVVASAIICAGLLYAQSPSLQLYKIFLNEFLFLFHTYNEKPFSFKNSGCRWYWSTSSLISKIGSFMESHYSADDSIYGKFRPISDLFSSDFMACQLTKIKLDTQFYPFYLSRIKGFSFEGHALAVCFALGLTVFSLCCSSSIHLNRIFEDIMSVLFIEKRKDRIVLNHPVVSSPFLLSLCMSSFCNNHPIHQKVFNYLKVLFSDISYICSLRMDILFHLSFYFVNVQFSASYYFDDLKKLIPGEVYWLLDKLEFIPNNVSDINWLDPRIDITFFKNSSKFSFFKKLVYSPAFVNSYFAKEIVDKFKLPLRNHFFINQAVLSSITILLAYLQAKVFWFHKSRVVILPDSFHSFYYLMAYLYALLDCSFSSLITEGIIIDAEFTFSGASFNFKNICNSLLILFESLISIASLAFVASSQRDFVSFLTRLQRLNLSRSSISLCPELPEDITNCSVLRSLFNRPRFYSSLSQSLGLLCMKTSDREMFTSQVSFPLMYVSTFPIGDEIIQPDLGYPDCQPATDDVTQVNVQTTFWDRLPIHCRYFFLRLLKPSKYTPSSDPTLISSSIFIQAKDVESFRDVSGTLVGKHSFEVPGMHAAETVKDAADTLFSLPSLNCLPIYFPKISGSVESLLLYTKQSAHKDMYTCPIANLYNIRFPFFPLVWSESDFMPLKSMLEAFYHTISEISRIRQFFENLTSGDVSYTDASLSDSRLKDLILPFQLCHYLFVVDRLEEAYIWLDILGNNESRNEYKVILNTLSKSHPDVFLYKYFAETLSRHCQ